MGQSRIWNLFHFRVWPQRQGPFADPSDLQRELAILTGFGPCHRASSEDFASCLVSLSHTHPTQIRTCDHCLENRCPNHRLAVRIWNFRDFSLHMSVGGTIPWAHATPLG